jgi:CubicO group peptidase (beta-lactamase class C family)
LRAPEQLSGELSRIVRSAQAEHRLPSLSGAVFRAGEVVWAEAVGLADAESGTEATPDTQYHIASITKTFTASSVLQLRDAGELELDDPLSKHIPEAAHGTLTIRRMLAHASGLQREPVGEIWETLEFPTRDELLERLAEAEQVLAPGPHWHYSNLAYVLLGEVVERASGLSIKQYVEERLLRPLGLERTTWSPEEPYARGYFVEPYSDSVRPEPDIDSGGTSAAGALCSTSGDLARWGSFLADPDPNVLSPHAADEMHALQVMAEPDWTLGWGLGLALFRHGERIFAGHMGGYPGHLSMLVWAPKEKVGAVVLANSSVWPKLTETALELETKAVEHLAVPPEPWRPAEHPPDDVAPLLGRWWSEGSEVIFSYRQGRLEARLASQPEKEPSVFEAEGEDRYRTVAGPERGELLRVVRDENGDVVKLYWATYPFLRSPEVLGAQRSPTAR